MLKPLTLSLSLVVALGASSVSMAGLFDKHHSGAMASPQGVIASPQEVMPSSQCDTGGCGDVCETGGKKKCKLLGFLHRPKNYSYTWVLKKKRIHGHKGGDCGGGAAGGCDSCDTGGVYPSGQYSSPQALGSGQSYVPTQAYGSGQAYGGASGQAYGGPSGQAYGGSSGQAYGGSSGQAYGGSSGQAYGAGQANSAPQPNSTMAPGAGQMAPGAGQMTPAPAGDEAPPAPEVPAPSSAPAAPETPSPNAPQSSLLFSTPAGN